MYGIDTKLPDGSELTRFPYNGEIHDIDEIHLPVTVVEWENEDDASEYNILPETIDSDDTDSKMLYAYFSERLRRYDEQRQSGSAQQSDTSNKHRISKVVTEPSDIPQSILSPLDPIHRNFAHIMSDNDNYTHMVWNLRRNRFPLSTRSRMTRPARRSSLTATYTQLAC